MPAKDSHSFEATQPRIAVSFAHIPRGEEIGDSLCIGSRGCLNGSSKPLVTRLSRRRVPPTVDRFEMNLHQCRQAFFRFDVGWIREAGLGGSAFFHHNPRLVYMNILQPFSYPKVLPTLS